MLNTRDYNLARGAPDLLARLSKASLPSEVKPEITESMIEVNSTVQRGFAELRDELVRTRDGIVEAAGRLNLAVAGGGSHPFHKWSERRIFPTERFLKLSALYGSSTPPCSLDHRVGGRHHLQYESRSALRRFIHLHSS